MNLLCRNYILIYFPYSGEKLTTDLLAKSWDKGLYSRLRTCGERPRIRRFILIIDDRYVWSHEIQCWRGTTITMTIMMGTNAENIFLSVSHDAWDWYCTCHKYWNTLIPYHTIPGLWKVHRSPVEVFKKCWINDKLCRPWSAESDLNLNR